MPSEVCGRRRPRPTHRHPLDDVAARRRAPLARGARSAAAAALDLPGRPRRVWSRVGAWEATNLLTVAAAVVAAAATRTESRGLPPAHRLAPSPATSGCVHLDVRLDRGGNVVSRHADGDDPPSRSPRFDTDEV